MNTGSVNSNAVNAPSTSYVVGVLTAIAVTFAGNTEANAMVYGGSTGAVTVTVNSSSSQYHKVSMVTGGTVINGTSNTLRYANYVPKYAPLDVTGSAKSYLQAYGGNSGTVNSSGIIAPNYYIEPNYAQDGTINVTIETEANNRKIGRAFGNISFGGLFVIPKTVPVYDIDTVIEFNGRCLAVDKIGYGNPGNINIAVNTEGVRTTVCAAAGNIDVTLGSLVTNYIGVGKSSGSISVTGLVNVAIKYKDDHHYTHYYEDWLEWDVGSLDIEPLAYKVGVSNNSTSNKDINVTMSANTTIRARGSINNGYLLYTVASVDYGRIAGSRNSVGTITVTGKQVSYGVTKPNVINTNITVVGTGYGKLLAVGYAIGNLVTTGNVYPEIVVKTVPSTGSTYLIGTTEAVRVVIGTSISTCTVTGTIVPRVYKNAKATTNVVISGSTKDFVSLTVNTGYLSVTGFTKGYRVVKGISVGTVVISGSVPDSRLAIKAYSVGNVTTTRSTALEDYRLAIKAYMNAGTVIISGSVPDSRLAIKAHANIGSIVLGNMVDDFRLAVRGDNEGSVDVTANNRDFRLAVRGDNTGLINIVTSNSDFRLAIRLDSRTNLDITGRADSVTNLYSNADETRQMSVPASDWANGEYLHYMEVQA